MTRLLALDPGEVTGWSLWEWQYESDRHAERTDYGLVKGGVEGFKKWFIGERPVPIGLVVCEKYQLDQRTTSPNTTPLVIEGVLIALCAVPIVWQPTSAKSEIHDDVLKKTNLRPGPGPSRLWLTGKDPKIKHTDARDVNDSQIHALAYLRHAHRPTAAWLYPDPEG